MRSSTASNDIHRLFVAETLLVNALCNQRIEHIGNSHDSCRQRNFFALEVIRITGAVPLFVMETCHFNRFVQVICVKRIACIFHNLLQNLSAFRRMALHYCKFFVGQFTILVQNQIGHGNLSDIMERCRLFQLMDIGITENTLELALRLQFLRNRFHVFGGLFDVVSRALVTSFDHLSKFHNDDLLHALDSVFLFVHLMNKVVYIASHIAEIFIQLSDFVCRFNIQFFYFINSITDTRQINISHFESKSGTHRFARNFHCRKRHFVHRNHDTAFNHFNDNHHDYQRKSKEQREQLYKEHGLVADNRFHGNICRHVCNSFPRFILNGLIDRQEPTILVIRNNRFNFFAIQKFRQVRFKGRIERNHAARSTAWFIVGIQVKYDMTAIL